METLESLPDLLAAEDPLSWAGDNLVLIGRGDTASVFAHPDVPGIAVRISDYPDGWFGYAMALDAILGDDPPRALREAITRHAPAPLDLRYLEGDGGGFYLALCERLQPLGDEGDGLVDAARSVMRTDYPPCMEPDDEGELATHGRAWVGHAVGEGRLVPEAAARLLSEQPGLLVMAQALPPSFGDLRDGNWMARGTHLVLNDPSRGMSHEDDERFRSRYGNARGPSPA